MNEKFIKLRFDITVFILEFPGQKPIKRQPLKILLAYILNKATTFKACLNMYRLITMSIYIDFTHIGSCNLLKYS